MIETLRSAVIPVPFVHGFTTRAGGVSRPPFDSWNLGRKWGDDLEAVVENRRRLAHAAGTEAIYWATQVHGAGVVRVSGGDDRSEVAKREADALVSDTPGLALAVYVADCTAVLLADARTGAFAAAHAGWRGTVAGVVVAALERLVADFGTRPADVRVAMGPCIGPCCFEVGPEVVAAVERLVPDARGAGVVIETAGRKPHVDLRRANASLLSRAGVPVSGIEMGAECTFCDRERFFSYRRDAGRTGQMVGFIGRR